MELRKLTHEIRVESEAEVVQQIEKFKQESTGLVDLTNLPEIGEYTSKWKH